MERLVCIHGHFYQPPRENPWLETIEVQDGAAPYHDWNRRVTAECYAVNATSRILDDQDRILRIVNNYEKMSFNFGPTLLSWLETGAPFVYQAVLEADQRSRERFSGHGSALAQPYNHLIMPLASARDKETQVVWGIRDFERRFGRRPEGMWLPETAVDSESLDIMAARGIRFTILAPHQARRWRPSARGAWKDAGDSPVDTRLPHRVRLPSGREMVVFFYNGEVSRAVAFEQLLSSGEALAERLAGGFSADPDGAQLVHIATDGESYGHHHRFGDMALAYAVHTIESRRLARMTNYGEFLAHHPPVREAEVAENTSWSCAHGVERWRADCGCHTGAHPGWSQAWRVPLRSALDGLSEDLSRLFEREGGKRLRDPWSARNDYIDVILDRSDESRSSFLARHAAAPVEGPEETFLLKLLEMQRHAMLMHTSCGWFFDDVSGIETVQILLYAARAIELAEGLGARDPGTRFLKTLAGARSNRREQGTGREIYERAVKRSRADLCKVGAHHAMCRLFHNGSDAGGRFHCYRIEDEVVETRQAGKASLLLGRGRFLSEITREAGDLCFGALHLGDHNLTGGVVEGDSHRHDSLVEELGRVFEAADFHESLRRFDRCFPRGTYGLKSLFRDEQRRILGRILEATLNDVEGVYRRLYDDQIPLMRFLMDAEAPLPKALNVAAELVLHADLKRRFQSEEIDPEGIESILREARGVGVTFDAEPLEFAFRRSLERAATRLLDDPDDPEPLGRVDAALSLLDELPFKVNLRTAQNICYHLKEVQWPRMRKRAEAGDEAARSWTDRFGRVCRKLWVRID
jgi:alpha-amylase/alpha-mannosidase (GH57 family)